MTGPEHFKEAENLLDVAVDEYEGDDAHRAFIVASAQVHATLALVAATLDTGQKPFIRGAQWTAALKGEEIPATGGFQFEDLNSIPKRA